MFIRSLMRAGDDWVTSLLQAAGAFADHRKCA
jgi:hypothetical protein